MDLVRASGSVRVRAWIRVRVRAWVRGRRSGAGAGLKLARQYLHVNLGAPGRLQLDGKVLELATEDAR